MLARLSLLPVLVLLACREGGAGGMLVVGTTSGGGSPLDTATVDTGEPVPRGGVRLTYAWQDGLGVASCHDAGLTSLTVDPDDGRDAITFPCADAEIRVDDVKVGHHVLTVVGETSVGSLWRATAEIDVAEGATTDVPVVLTCDENGVMDACGGG